jgi:hypothetical protein
VRYFGLALALDLADAAQAAAYHALAEAEGATRVSAAFAQQTAILEASSGFRGGGGSRDPPLPAPAAPAEAVACPPQGVRRRVLWGYCSSSDEEEAAGPPPAPAHATDAGPRDPLPQPKAPAERRRRQQQKQQSAAWAGEEEGEEEEDDEGEEGEEEGGFPLLVPLEGRRQRRHRTHAAPEPAGFEGGLSDEEEDGRGGDEWGGCSDDARGGLMSSRTCDRDGGGGGGVAGSRDSCDKRARQPRVPYPPQARPGAAPREQNEQDVEDEEMEDAGKAAAPLLSYAQQLRAAAEAMAKAAASGALAGGFHNPLLGGGAPFGAAAQLAGAADTGQSDASGRVRAVGGGQAIGGLHARPGRGEGGDQRQPGPQGGAAGAVRGLRPQGCGLVLAGHYPSLQTDIDILRQGAQGGAAWEQIEDPLLAAHLLCQERGLEARLTAEKHMIKLDSKAAAEESLLPFKPTGAVLVDVRDGPAARQQVPKAKAQQPRRGTQPGPHFGLRRKAGREELWYRSGIRTMVCIWSVRVEVRDVAKVRCAPAQGPQL